MPDPTDVEVYARQLAALCLPADARPLPPAERLAVIHDVGALLVELVPELLDIRMRRRYAKVTVHCEAGNLDYIDVTATIRKIRRRAS